MKHNTQKSLTFPRASYGFTLIEMLLVVGIIAVLTAVSIPMISHSLENTKIHTDEANERAAKGAAMTEYLSNGTFGKVAGGVTAYYDAAAGQWKSSNTDITPYGKCETEEHTDLVLGGELSYADGSLRLFWIPSGETGKFSRLPAHSGLTVEYTYQVASADAISNWDYMINADDTVTLNYYIGNETEVIVYGNYPIGGKTYKTRLAGVSMFDGYSRENCTNIQTIKFSNAIDTSDMTNMTYMFYECTALQFLDLSNFDTSNVTYMNYVFDGCTALTNLDLSNFNTSKVTEMEGMFSACGSLTSLNLSNFDTSNVTNMDGMFAFCNNLQFLDVSNFNTSNVTDMNYMFGECTALTNLDLSSFDTSKVTDMRGMFAYCGKLSTLTTSEKWVKKEGCSTDNMFYLCNSLPGEQKNFH